MKNLKLILLAIVVSLAGVSCSSSDDDNNNGNGNGGTSANSMNLDGVEFDISTAVLVGYGESDVDGSYDWDVVFLGEGLTVNNQELAGSGATLYLDLNTNNPDGLRAGTYTYSPNYEREVFTWVDIEACQNSEGDDCQSGLTLPENGTVVITGSGSNTTIEVTVTDNNGATITANYTGGFIFL